VLAGFENRQSSIASKNFAKYAIGANLDFDADFVRPRWPGSR